MRTFATREPFLQRGTPKWNTSIASNRCSMAGNLPLTNLIWRPTTCLPVEHYRSHHMANRWCCSRARKRHATPTSAPTEACAWPWRPARQKPCNAGTTGGPSTWMEPSGTCRNSQRRLAFQAQAITWQNFPSKQWMGMHFTALDDRLNFPGRCLRTSWIPQAEAFMHDPSRDRDHTIRSQLDALCRQLPRRVSHSLCPSRIEPGA